MKKDIAIIAIFIFMYLPIIAQQHEWEQYLYQLSGIEDIESETLETYFDLLCDLENNPININTATRNELEQIPFLTAKDVEDISEYLYMYGPMKNLGELAMIKNLDYFKRRLLFYFTYAGEIKTKKFPSINPDWLILGQGKPYRNQSETEHKTQPTLFNDVENTNIQDIKVDFTETEPRENEIKQRQSSSVQRKIKRITVYFDDNTFEEYYGK